MEGNKRIIEVLLIFFDPVIMTNMLVATWNIAGNQGISPKRLRQIEGVLRDLGADIVLLQEVRAGELTATVRDMLADHGLLHSSFSTDRVEKKHGVAVASRWPIRSPHVPGGRSFEAATIESPTGPLLVISTHIPNGVGNGWKKAYSMEELGEYIEKVSGPLIVGGDFNEPREFGPDLIVEPFGRGPRLSRSWDDYWTDRFGVTDRLSKWRDACRRLLQAGNDLDLSHAFFSLYPEERPVTHVTTGSEDRFFDHLLVRGLNVADAGFNHEVRESGASDHSLAWARLEGPSE